MENNEEMYEQRPKKYRKKLRLKKTPLIIAIAVLTLFLGTSYAVLTIVLTGKEELSIVAGNLKIEYKDGDVINLANTYPMSDKKGMKMDVYEFSVKNTGDIDAKYTISLEKADVESPLDDSYIKYSLKRDNGDWSQADLLSNVNLILDSDIEIKPNETVNYQLKLWTDRYAGNEAQDKTFKARVVVNAVQSNTKP